MEKMPNDLILEIFKFFPPKTLATQLALVCRRWNNLAFSPCLWTQLDVEVKEFERFESYINPTLTRVAPGLRRLKLEMYTDRTFLPEVISTITELSNLVELCLSCCVDEITAETMSLLTIKCPLVQVAHMYECDQVNDAGLLALGRGWPDLRHIKLSTCLLSEAGLIAFFNCAIKLESFNSYSNWANTAKRSVGLNGRDPVAAGEGLPIRDYSICTETFSHISAQYLQQFSCLRHLHLQNCYHLSETALVELFSQPRFPHLRCLAIVYCWGMTDSCINHITSRLDLVRLTMRFSLGKKFSYPSLQLLKLTGTKRVTDVGVKMIVERCRDLLILSLGWLEISISMEIFNSVPHPNLPKLQLLELDTQSREVLSQLTKRFNMLVFFEKYDQIPWAEIQNVEGTIKRWRRGCSLEENREWLKGPECCWGFLSITPRFY